MNWSNSQTPTELASVDWGFRTRRLCDVVRRPDNHRDKLGGVVLLGVHTPARLYLRDSRFGKKIVSNPINGRNEQT